MISVHKITDQQELKRAFKIREEVFVREQEVAPEEEYDEYEETSTHFIAYDADGNPCGTARWRRTDHGIKLERFAVLKKFRKTGIGSLLVKRVLDDILKSSSTEPITVYMHAQTHAVPFYKKFGFESTGPEFDECGIMHFEMHLKNKGH